MRKPRASLGRDRRRGSLSLHPPHCLPPSPSGSLPSVLTRVRHWRPLYVLLLDPQLTPPVPSGLGADVTFPERTSLTVPYKCYPFALRDFPSWHWHCLPLYNQHSMPLSPDSLTRERVPEGGAVEAESPPSLRAGISDLQLGTWNHRGVIQSTDLRVTAARGAVVSSSGSSSSYSSRPQVLTSCLSPSSPRSGAPW